mgnify:FL=1|jgi:hypothetical protein
MTTISNNTENELYIKQTLTNLQRIFHQHLIMCDLHLYNTKDKMMNLLRKESGEQWNVSFILDLAKNNKIIWIQGSSDPTDYESYKKRYE